MSGRARKRQEGCWDSSWIKVPDWLEEWVVNFVPPSNLSGSKLAGYSEPSTYRALRNSLENFEEVEGSRVETPAYETLALLRVETERSGKFVILVVCDEAVRV